MPSAPPAAGPRAPQTTAGTRSGQRGGESLPLSLQPKAAEDLGPLDIWSLRDHIQDSQKISNGGKRLIDIFKAMDTDRSGALSRYEFSIALNKFGFNSATDAEISAVVQQIDADGSGSVQYKELEKILKRLGPRPPPMVEQPHPPAPPPKPFRGRFPRAIDPDAPFAQPTCAQMSALAVSNWKRREHARAQASEPRERAHALGSDEEGALGSLALVLSRLDMRGSRSSSTTEEELSLLLRSAETNRSQARGDRQGRFIFKSSIVQGSISRRRARGIMAAAGHVGSVSHSCKERPRSQSPTACRAQSDRSGSTSPPRMDTHDHLREVGPDLAQISVKQAALAKAQPLEVRHVRERLVQRYAC